jgi:hypothetical protein
MDDATLEIYQLTISKEKVTILSRGIRSYIYMCMVSSAVSDRREREEETAGYDTVDRFLTIQNVSKREVWIGNRS